MKQILDDFVVKDVYRALDKYFDDTGDMHPNTIVFNTKHYYPKYVPDGQVLQLAGMNVEFADMKDDIHFFLGKVLQIGNYRMVLRWTTSN